MWQKKIAQFVSKWEGGYFRFQSQQKKVCMKTNMTDGEKKRYNTGYSEIVVPDTKHRVVRFKFLLLRAENIFF